MVVVLCLVVLLAGGGFNGKQAQLVVRDGAFGVCAVWVRWCSSKGSERKCLSQPVTKSRRQSIIFAPGIKAFCQAHFHMLAVKSVCHMIKSTSTIRYSA